ncbi:MAG TPA: ORF6N domain-containing protein [Candidatus Gastranaerophilales bacterium]|nr:ORF6N domain-containing protein [Candidatus Gastranaerophilales bacterium]
MDSVIVSKEIIENKIHVIRGHKVMLDSDLALFYGVETKVLNQAIKRNISRFPIDFMFQITNEEWENLKSQIVASSWGGRRKLPYAFTEHGVLMLSSVLNSEKAIQVNIQIIRVFNNLRQLASSPVQEISEFKKLLLLYMEANDHKQQEQDNKIFDIIQVLNNLLEGPKESKQIGFRAEE